MGVILGLLIWNSVDNSIWKKKYRESRKDHKQLKEDSDAKIRDLEEQISVLIANNTSFGLEETITNDEVYSSESSNSVSRDVIEPKITPEDARILITNFKAELEKENVGWTRSPELDQLLARSLKHLSTDERELVEWSIGRADEWRRTMSEEKAGRLQEKTEFLFNETLKEFEKVLIHGTEEEKADVRFSLQNKEMMTLFGEMTEVTATALVD